jgi:hypothetical protein
MIHNATILKQVLEETKWYYCSFIYLLNTIGEDITIIADGLDTS